MATTRPGFGHSFVLSTEPGRGASATASGIFGVVTAAVLIWAITHRNGTWPASWPPGSGQVPQQVALVVAYAAAALLVLSLTSTAHHLYRRHVGRQLERLSTSPTTRALVRVAPPDHERRLARVVPELDVVSVTARKWVRPRGLTPVDPRRNVLGERPVRIGYLRIFQNAARARTFVQGAWGEFGYVHLLRSAHTVPARERRALLRGQGEGMFVTTPDELHDAFDRELARPPRGRGLHRIRNVSTYGISSWDRFGAYPVVAPLCHGQFWRDAVVEMLGRVDVVVLDLSGIQERNEGTLFELQNVIDHFPVERVVFLADVQSSKPYLASLIHEAWEGMAESSPNAGYGRCAAVLAPVDVFVTTVQRDSQGHETQRQTRLHANRWETRKLAAWLQSTKTVTARSRDGAHAAVVPPGATVVDPRVVDPGVATSADRSRRARPPRAGRPGEADRRRLPGGHRVGRCSPGRGARHGRRPGSEGRPAGRCGIDRHDPRDAGRDTHGPDVPAVALGVAGTFLRASGHVGDAVTASSPLSMVVSGAKLLR